MSDVFHRVTGILKKATLVAFMLHLAAFSNYLRQPTFLADNSFDGNEVSAAVNLNDDVSGDLQIGHSPLPLENLIMATVNILEEGACALKSGNTS